MTKIELAGIVGGIIGFALGILATYIFLALFSLDVRLLFI
jgi:hypothetical protein|tara:strand:- start:1677 stop:1796 length:120 start_codon:yes stop_codon:yes gene_type:complete